MAIFPSPLLHGLPCFFREIVGRMMSKGIHWRVWRIFSAAARCRGDGQKFFDPKLGEIRTALCGRRSPLSRSALRITCHSSLPIFPCHARLFPCFFLLLALL